MQGYRLNRRTFITSATSAGLAAPFAAFPAGHSKRLLNLQDPADNLTAMVKMRASLEAVDCPYWYFGTIYAALPGKTPFPMIDFEGSEIDYFQKQTDGSYRAYAATVSFFRDTRTRKRLHVFENPITGKRNEVRANSISVKAHYIYSVDGARRSDDTRPQDEMPTLLELTKWTESGDHIWLNMNRPYPKGLPMGEDQTMRGSLRELHDPDMPKVYTTANPTYVAPWLRWMDMAGHPGHTVWAGPARKLDSVKEYPRELLDFMEKNFPEKLTAKPT
jgi:hypothetical protein